MGLGKTLQLIVLIRELGPDAKILIIAHRITLCDALAQELEDLGFVLYSNITEEPIDARRVVVTINSLWRVNERDFDLVSIDEIPEVIVALTTLMPNQGKGGRWQVLEKSAGQAPPCQTSATHERAS